MNQGEQTRLKILYCVLEGQISVHKAGQLMEGTMKVRLGGCWHPTAEQALLESLTGIGGKYPVNAVPKAVRH